MTYGYHGAVLHVDMTTQTTRVEHPDANFYRIYAGGGLMGTYYLLKETRAGIDPLGPDNLLIFNNSVVAGYPAAGLVRYIVTTKSEAVVPGAVRLGTVGGREVGGVPVAQLREANEAFFKDWMEA